MKTFYSVSLVLLFVALTSCSRKPQTPVTQQSVQAVKIETIKTSSIDDSYEAVGTVRAKVSSVIAARIMGNIVKLNVHEGDRVQAGQTLMEIENQEAGTQIAKAQAGVRESTEALEEVQRQIRAAEAAQGGARANERLAQSTFNRYQTLFQRKSVSPQEFDEVRSKLEIAKAESDVAERTLQVARAKQEQMRARIDQAKADVASARIFAGYSRLVAPINGVVVTKQVDVGTMATPGAPLITIESDSSYQLEVAVGESQLRNVHLNDQAQVQIAALGDQELTATVFEIVPASDPNSRSYTVKLALPVSSEFPIRSGLYGKARFISGQRQTLAIPQKAVTQLGQLISVFVVDQSGVARRRLIKTGKSYGDRIEVLSGLTDGEQIVAEVPSSLQDGARVKDAQQVATR